MENNTEGTANNHATLSVVVFVALLIIGAWVVIPSPSTPSAPAINPPSASAQAPEKQPDPGTTSTVPKTSWDYSASKDAMGLGEVQIARNESLNTVDFSFPYGGPQHARLYLRSHPQYGKDLYLTISRGQILTDVSDGCRVLLRFDDEKPTWVTGSGPTDHGSTTVFLSGVAPLINRMKKAKRLRIQIPVYQEGNPVFEFDIEGLQWPMKK